MLDVMPSPKFELRSVKFEVSAKLEVRRSTSNLLRTSTFELHTSVRSHPLPVELRLRAATVHLQRALLAGRVRTDEDPVLPRRQPAEDARRLMFRQRKPQVRLHARQRVRRERHA